ncbi:MAG: branched-chain amino acid transaminase [Candidatus Actinomarina sp.]
MEKSDFIWFDGEFVDWDNAQINVMTHTLHYGTGVFEGIRARNTEQGVSIFRLNDHVDRLFASAASYNLKIPYTKEVIFEAIKDVVSKNKLESAYIRPLVFFGEGEMGLLPTGVPVRVSIAAWLWGAYLGDDAVNEGVNVCISKWKRISPTSFIPLAKGVGGYMNSTLAKIDAVDNGYDDAIMLGDDGTVAEGSGQNIFIVKNNNIFTPPNSTGALNGITRRTVIEIAKSKNISIEEKNLTVDDLKNADEVFFTGTATGVIGVVSIDGDDISNGKVGEITSDLINSYEDVVNAKDDNFKSYITLI